VPYVGLSIAARKFARRLIAEDRSAPPALEARRARSIDKLPPRLLTDTIHIV